MNAIIRESFEEFQKLCPARSEMKSMSGNVTHYYCRYDSGKCHSEEGCPRLVNEDKIRTKELLGDLSIRYEGDAVPILKIELERIYKYIRTYSSYIPSDMFPAGPYNQAVRLIKRVLART